MASVPVLKALNQVNVNVLWTFKPASSSSISCRKICTDRNKPKPKPTRVSKVRTFRDFLMNFRQQKTTSHFAIRAESRLERETLVGRLAQLQQQRQHRWEQKRLYSYLCCCRCCWRCCNWWWWCYWHCLYEWCCFYWDCSCLWGCCFWCCSFLNFVELNVG